MSTSGRSRLRSARLSAGVAAATTLLGGATALAAPPAPAPCHTNPREVDTLDITVDPGPAVRGRDLRVEVVVTRRAGAGIPTATIADARVSVRLRTRGAAPEFAGGQTDSTGRAVLLVAVRRDLPIGDATLVAEAWAERTPGYWCVPSVQEHGYVELPARVSSH